jgi:hypothetical protein
MKPRQRLLPKECAVASRETIAIESVLAGTIDKEEENTALHLSIMFPL